MVLLPQSMWVNMRLAADGVCHFVASVRFLQASLPGIYSMVKRLIRK
jgi:hypothetical protein